MNPLEEIEAAANDLQAKCDELEIEVNNLGHGGDRAGAREAAERLGVLRGDLENQKARLEAERAGHAIQEVLDNIPVAPGVVNQIRLLEVQFHEIGVFLDRTEARLNDILA